jgi:hypothetical protein
MRVRIYNFLVMVVVVGVFALMAYGVTSWRASAEAAPAPAPRPEVLTEGEFLACLAVGIALALIVVGFLLYAGFTTGPNSKAAQVSPGGYNSWTGGPSLEMPDGIPSPKRSYQMRETAVEYYGDDQEPQKPAEKTDEDRISIFEAALNSILGK